MNRLLTWITLCLQFVLSFAQCPTTTWVYYPDRDVCFLVECPSVWTNYYDQQSRCTGYINKQGQASTMATLDTAEVTGFLTAAVSLDPTKDYWIGLEKELLGVYTWKDGTAYDSGTALWALDQPDLIELNKFVVLQGSGHKWESKPSNDNHCFICQYYGDEAPTTVGPTTYALTTDTPTTVAPTTVAPTTVAPTTVASTTVERTTIALTTVALTTDAPTTNAPTTAALTTVPIRTGENVTLVTAWTEAIDVRTEMFTFPRNIPNPQYTNFTISIPLIPRGGNDSSSPPRPPPFAPSQPLFLQVFEVEDHEKPAALTEAPGAVFLGLSFLAFVVAEAVFLIILDVDLYVAGFRDMCANLRGGAPRRKKKKKKKGEKKGKRKEKNRDMVAEQPYEELENVDDAAVDEEPEQITVEKE